MINLTGNSGGFWTTPMIFGFAVGGAMLVAIGLVLYFLIFRHMIKRRRDENRAKRADANEKYTASTSMASSVFEERQARAEEAEAEKAVAADISELERKINANRGADAKQQSLTAKPKAAPKKQAAPVKKDTAAELKRLQQLKEGE